MGYDGFTIYFSILPVRLCFNKPAVYLSSTLRYTLSYGIFARTSRCTPSHQVFSSPPQPPILRIRLPATSDPIPMPIRVIISLHLRLTTQ
jgi:hypothetical protein